jgi:hypothetical protein
MQKPAGALIESNVASEAASLVGDTKAALVDGADTGFSLSAEQEDALLESLAQIERGDWISLEDLLATLPRQVDSAD